MVAQVSSAQGNFFAGISGSINGTGVTYQNNYGQKKMNYDGLNFSPFYGAFVGIAFDTKNQVIAEVVKTSYQVKYKDNLNGGIYQKSLKFEYTSIPLLYRRMLGNDEKNQQFFFTVGPQISFLNSASINQQINSSDVSFTTFVANANNPEATAGVAAALTKIGKTQPTANDLFNKTAFDGILGFGMLFYVSNSVQISAELRGGYSFSDLNQSDWHVKGYEKNEVVDYKTSHPYFGGLRVGIQYTFSAN